eukprot:scaffold19867_cov56-Phaeocystis_antarctica.AAC.4
MGLQTVCPAPGNQPHNPRPDYGRDEGARTRTCRRGNMLSSVYSMVPEPSGSKESKRASASGASMPGAGTALANSLLEMVTS